LRDVRKAESSDSAVLHGAPRRCAAAKGECRPAASKSYWKARSAGDGSKEMWRAASSACLALRQRPANARRCLAY
jgi:hypothetical protein